MFLDLNELYTTVTTQFEEPNVDEPKVYFYAKYVKKLDGPDDSKQFDDSLEIQKMSEGKLPTGKCIIWGCVKRTTRKCKCGCFQFVCKDCSFCILSDE